MVLPKMYGGKFVFCSTPNYGAADDNKSRDRSEPPIGAFTLREVYRKYREEWIVKYLFDKLLSWNRWYGRKRGIGNGQLCLGSDPYTDSADRYWALHFVNDIQGARFESGLDNSPMYDNIPFDNETNLMKLADVGLTGLYIHDCECLAELARVIDRSEEKELRERAELSKNGLEELWDEKFGLYLNKHTDTGEFTYRISPNNFYALFSDKVTPERARRIVDEHFFNAQEFFGEFMIPSIARNDQAYKDQEYWRGRIWGPMNYLVYIALRRHGLNDACKTLAEKSKNLLLKEWQDKGHVHENYNADTGEGCDVRSSDKFYHWGALLALVALIDAGYVAAPEKPL